LIGGEYPTLSMMYPTINALLEHLYEQNFAITNESVKQT